MLSIALLALSVHALRPQALNRREIAPQRSDRPLLAQLLDQAGVGGDGVTDNPVWRKPGKFPELGKDNFRRKPGRKLIRWCEQIVVPANAAFGQSLLKQTRARINPHPRHRHNHGVLHS